MRIPIDRYVKRGLFHLYAPLGWARRPNHVTLDVTRRCNLRCRMCFYYGGEGRSPGGPPEMTAAQIIERVIERVEGADYDVTGGEPLVRPDIFEILAAIKRKGAGCFIVTNGTLVTGEVAARLVEEDLLDLVTFSIHGDGPTHDQVTRVPGSFDKALRGIELIHQARARRGGKGPRTAIACTVNAGNMDAVDSILALKERTGVDSISLGCCSYLPEQVKVRHLQALERLGIDCDPGLDDLVMGPPPLEADPARVETFVGMVKAFREAGRIVGTTPQGYGYQDIRDHFLNHRWVYKKTCTYPWRNLRVLPDGSVVPCLGHAIGNVLRQDVMELWNNARFRRFRAALYKEKLFPGCFRCCKLK